MSLTLFVLLLSISLSSILGQSPTLILFAYAQELSDTQVNSVSARLEESAQLSWELGARAQAILELNATTYSVFSNTRLPPASNVPQELKQPLQIYFAIAQEILANIPSTSDGARALMSDGSAADPASNGITVLLANWTGLDNKNVDYEAAARNQLDFLFSDAVPRTQEGAISHRVDQLQLWSDFVYMVPPFFAYYGVLTGNRTLVREAYEKIRLYRQHLRDTRTGLWKHILLGTAGNDDGYWATGNGWAAAGMLRVHATIEHSEYADSFKKEKEDLGSWVSEIHDAVYKHIDSTSIFPNYIDRPLNVSGNFYDASSTALLAATVYRASTHLQQHAFIRHAEQSRETLFSLNPDAHIGDDNDAVSPFSGYRHFTPEGWLTPVVNPHSYGVEGSRSAEGQAFVVMLHAGYNEWKAAGRQGSAGGWSRFALRETVNGCGKSLLCLIAVIVLGFGQALYLSV
ncbi:Six-hairpin glycosidase [Coprinopsis marcescibilis]|uniref:Six-hairpin glycosidase n=1 Tax=Coprinopsis marcescibilis TaxID=230819 RepID=A0A5C3KIC0_COPMA|nr:Six-hairpin glycosidase [Coprinopsis marcescibilis]